MIIGHIACFRSIYCIYKLCPSSKAAYLNSGTGDEEPLVDAAVDWSRRKILTRRKFGDCALVDEFFRVGVGEVGTLIFVRYNHSPYEAFDQFDLQVNVSTRSSTSDESLPGVGTLTNDFEGIPVI